eukprot:89404-Rhodomonas_salina.1
MAHIDKLEGSLLLVHGLIDENVHFRHTARLINHMIRAQKHYELLLFPDERHCPRRFPPPQSCAPTEAFCCTDRLAGCGCSVLCALKQFKSDDGERAACRIGSSWKSASIASSNATWDERCRTSSCRRGARARGGEA